MRLKEARNISIKSRRLELGMTQSELATKLGVDQTAVCQWENGVGPKRSRLSQVAEALDCSVAELLREDKEAESL